MKSTLAINLTEAKSKLSALIDELIHKRKSYLIKRRGKPVAALIPMDEYMSLVGKNDDRGISSLAGCCGEIESFAKIMDEVVSTREKLKDRPVDF